MRTKIITTILWMLALPVFAALQMVDISTLTTNKITNGIVFPGIAFTNFTTNGFSGYTTVNTNALQIGDTPYQAFTKVNANFTLLAGFTNSLTTNGATADGQVPVRSNSVAGGYKWIPIPISGIATLLPTNATIPSISGNTGWIPTNSGTGGSGTFDYNSLSNTPTLGNAAFADTNLMSVPYATNSQTISNNFAVFRAGGIGVYGNDAFSIVGNNGTFIESSSNHVFEMRNSNVIVNAFMTLDIFGVDLGEIYPNGSFVKVSMDWQSNMNFSAAGGAYNFDKGTMRGNGSNLTNNQAAISALLAGSLVSSNQAAAIAALFAGTNGTNGTNGINGTNGADGINGTNGTGSGTTNFTLTGFVQGATTNNQLSTAGTNTVNLLITNLAIANQNGFGTNTTLVSGVSVTTTNLSVIGDTWLNNSNMHVYLTGGGVNGYSNSIPNMTSSNSPFGYVFTSNGGNPYTAFTNGSTTFYGDGQYVQFNFGSIVTVKGFAGTITFPSGGQGSIYFSTNGTTWTLYYNFSIGSFGTTSWESYFTTNFVASSIKWTATCFSDPVYNAFTLSSMNVFYEGLLTTNPIVNVISNSTTLEILSTNGVAINTNSSGGYDFYASRIGAASVTAGTVNSDTNNTTLENATQVLSTNVSASGNVNASSFTLNGVPLSFTTNSPLTIQYFVTNGAGVAASFNGIYKYSGASSYFRSYTNSATPGYYFLNSAGWNYFDTNNNALLAQSYSSLSVLGSYNGQTDWPTNKLLVSIYTNPVAIFLLAGAGGNTDGSLLTGLIPNYRAGITNIPTLTTSQAVLFSTPFSPTVGTNYSVSVSFDTALAAAVGFSTTSKTTNGFTVTLSGTITGAVQVDYAAWPYQ